MQISSSNRIKERATNTAERSRKSIKAYGACRAATSTGFATTIQYG